MIAIGFVFFAASDEHAATCAGSGRSRSA